MVGTFIVTGIAMLVAVPLGLGAAIYLAEYAAPRSAASVKPIIEVLAGIPSVVLGYFAIAFINPEHRREPVQRRRQGVHPAGRRDRRRDPDDPDHRLGGRGCPARRAAVACARRRTDSAPQRLQTSFRVVVPAGISGIVAAFILGMSRAIGETMVVAIAAGAVGGGLCSYDPLEPGQTMTAAMAALGFGSDQVAGDDLAFQSLYFVGLLLFFMTFLLNLVSDWLVRRVREVY